MKVRDSMTLEAATLQLDDMMDIASDIMSLGRIRHLPVVGADGVVAGVISQRDLFRAGVATTLDVKPGEARKWLAKVAVREVMSEPPITAGPDEPLGEVIDRMLEKNLGCLPVVESGRLVGILTEADALRACRSALTD